VRCARNLPNNVGKKPLNALVEEEIDEYFEWNVWATDNVITAVLVGMTPTIV
jgi:hypothetical protein